MFVTIMITMTIAIVGHEPVDDANLETMMTRNKIDDNDDDDHYFHGDHDDDEDIGHSDDGDEDSDD